jgi:LAO/AO transport system kinase
MPELDALVSGVLTGETRPVARALSLLEDDREAGAAPRRALLARLAEVAGPSHAVVGLTGPPGVGKSTLANALAQRWLAAELSVGMTAVDPTSSRTGGALLGDRARMHTEPGQRLFIRSLASRDRLGGLAPATRATTAVLRAGFDRTLVETVGVGQSEVAIETVVDTVVLVLQPGSGDALQFMKAGILEIPDIFVVHKADLGAVAEQTLSELKGTLAPTQVAWEPPTLLVSAETGAGLDPLLEALDAHQAHLTTSGEGARRRVAARTAWALELFIRRFGTWGLDQVGGRAGVVATIEAAPGTALDAFAALTASVAS